MMTPSNLGVAQFGAETDDFLVELPEGRGSTFDHFEIDDCRESCLIKGFSIRGPRWHSGT